MINVLNDVEEIIYISDPENYNLLFLNSAALKTYNLKETPKNEKCYKVLHGLNKPCPFCKLDKLSFEKSYNWEIKNKVLNKHFLIKEKLISYKSKTARIGIAIDINDIYNKNQELLEEKKIDKFILKCTKILHSNNSFSENINTILKEITFFLKSERTYIFEFDFKNKKMSNTFEYTVSNSKSQIENLQGLDINLIQRWLKFLKHDTPVYIESLEDIKIYKTEYDFLKSLDLKKVLVVPLLSRENELIGYIGADNPAELKSKKHINSLLKTIAFFIVSSYEQMQMNALLKKQSFTDDLTKLNNRNKYTKDIELYSNSEISNCGIIFIDMNGLKILNDTKGHSAGDKALITIANYLRQTFEERFIYRIGGDEFVIICSDIEENLFKKKIETLKKISELEKPSFSIGYIWKKLIPDFESELRRADKYMYREKNLFYALKRKV